MPEVKYYLVTQTRQVKVTANTETDAARIATVAFETGQNSDHGVKLQGPSMFDIEGVWGNTTSKIEVVGLTIDVERK